MENLQTAVSNLSMSDLNEEYTFQNPYPQQFSLPYPIIKYMIQNPTGEAWKKLIQTCKYFYSKNPIFPVQCLSYVSDRKWNGDGRIIDFKKSIPKIWLYDELFAFLSYAPLSNAFSLLIPKIYKFDCQDIFITRQNFTWDEYQILTSSESLEDLGIEDTTIRYSDGTIATLDKLIEVLKNVERLVFYCTPSTIKADTVQKMIEIFPRLKKLWHIELREVPQSFDVSLFLGFTMKNKIPYIDLDFDDNFPDSYISTLNSFVDKLIEKPPKRMPFIRYRGLNGVRYNKYYLLRYPGSYPYDHS